MKFLIKLAEGIYAETEAPDLQTAKQQYEKIKEENNIEIKPTETQAKKKKTKGLHSHLLMLKEEGFFGSPRSLPEIRKKLKEFAIHYPSTTFPSYLNKLVRERTIRRFKERRNKGEVWVYVKY